MEWPGAVCAARRGVKWPNDERQEGLRERLSARGEEAIGEFAHALADNPYLNQFLHAAFGARDRALAAQKTARDALDIPAASDLERLSRNLRALSERIERLEDAVAQLERRDGTG
jgi:hypothetical protein